MVNTGGIYFSKKAAGSLCVFGHDAFAMPRAVTGNVFEGFIQTANDLDGYAEGEEFGAKRLSPRPPC